MEFLQNYWLPTLISVICGYLLGSISPSIIITKIYLKKDIRSFGSGNAGSTNVLRSVGKLPALLTLLGDILKAVIGCIIGSILFSSFAVALGDVESVHYLIKYGCAFAGTASVLGHMFPVYYGFKGGKGVVVAATIMGFIDWRVLLVALACFIITFVLKRIVSLSAINAAIGYFLGTLFFTIVVDYLPNKDVYPFSYLLTITIFAFFIAAIVVFMHRANIKRLRLGTEKKITFSKK